MRNIYLIGILFVWLSSCGNKMTHPQEGGDTLSLKYATLLNIVDYDGYSVATISNPWREGKILHTYVLVPRESEMPEHLPSGTIIRTPIQRATVFTTVHCSLLTTFGLGERIVGVADLKYIKIPYIHEQVKNGRIADCGNGLSPTVEKIMDIIRKNTAEDVDFIARSIMEYALFLDKEKASDDMTVVVLGITEDSPGAKIEELKAVYPF